MWLLCNHRVCTITRVCAFSLEAEIHTYKTEVLKLERQLKEVNGQLSSTSKNLNMSQGMSAVNQDSLIALRAERDSLHTECASLRAQNTKLLTEQVSVINSFMVYLIFERFLCSLF